MRHSHHRAFPSKDQELQYAHEYVHFPSYESKIRDILEQLNPSPSVNGSLHVHVKFGLSNPSLVQSAFTSHGIFKQGSGTIIIMLSYDS